jgi:hypothetical protein
MATKLPKFIPTRKAFAPVFHAKYNQVELGIIKDAKEMGFTCKEIAKMVNKKMHHNGFVRSTEGVRKVK